MSIQKVYSRNFPKKNEVWRFGGRFDLTFVEVDNFKQVFIFRIPEEIYPEFHSYMNTRGVYFNNCFKSEGSQIFFHIDFNMFRIWDPTLIGNRITHTELHGGASHTQEFIFASTGEDHITKFCKRDVIRISGEFVGEIIELNHSRKSLWVRIIEALSEEYKAQVVEDMPLVVEITDLKKGVEFLKSSEILEEF